MNFTVLTIEALKSLASIVGNYGLAIIVLTVVIRLAMWPLNVSQQRSMKKMQVLQPKLKSIQDRYKSDPQKMQTKMMEFYKEHKFNPMGGCLPLLIQMPIFILLYSALMSPQFIQTAGDSSFLGVNLSTTLRATAGISDDGLMGISPNDKFAPGKTATVYLPEETIENVKITAKSLETQGDIKPGENADFKLSLDNLDLKFSQLDQIQKADITVSNLNTRENEKAVFERKDGLLVASVPTKAVEQSFHWDVLILIAIFGATMWLSQKIMMAANKGTTGDPTQEAIQKSMGTFMPIMIIGTFIIIPIPAGVLLYLVTSNVLQIAQTVIVNKQIDMEEAKKVDEIDLSNAKKIEPK
jgi:YidC/Oxa1 family membrane protein insertase